MNGIGGNQSTGKKIQSARRSQVESGTHPSTLVPLIHHHESPPTPPSRTTVDPPHNTQPITLMSRERGRRKGKERKVEGGERKKGTHSFLFVFLSFLRLFTSQHLFPNFPFLFLIFSLSFFFSCTLFSLLMFLIFPFSSPSSSFSSYLFSSPGKS